MLLLSIRSLPNTDAPVSGCIDPILAERTKDFLLVVANQSQALRRHLSSHRILTRPELTMTSASDLEYQIDGDQTNSGTTGGIDLLVVEGLQNPLVLTLGLLEYFEKHRFNLKAFGDKLWREVASYINQETTSVLYQAFYVVTDSEDEFKLYSNCVKHDSVKFVCLPSGSSCSIGDVIWTFFVQFGVGRLGFKTVN